MAILQMIGPYSINSRDRRLASPPEGKKQAWTEYQVKQGRRVISRHDTEDEAVKAAKKRLFNI